MKTETDLFDPKYLVTLDEIYHSHWAARKKRRIGFMRKAVNSLWPEGHPTRLIHITGTNGKGSVAHYLEQGLALMGSAGSWTGPHVFDYAERFHINGEKVAHENLVRLYRDVLEPFQCQFVESHGGASLSFAEMGILMSLLLFQEHRLQWGIMEVGAGGRYTPLMGLSMAACVLTNVGNDHPKTLGAHLWQRALEKAGIARRGIPFFTAAKDRDRDYVCRTAEAEGAPVHVVDDHDLQQVRSAITGKAPPFKLRNLALACKVIRHFYHQASVADLVAAMTANLPGRFWRVQPNVIADVAHNPDKMAVLAEELRTAFPGRKFHFLLGLTRERAVAQVFAPILKLALRVTVTGASYAGRDPAEVATSLRTEFPEIHVEGDPPQAYAQAVSALGEKDTLVLTGSAYMIDQALNPNPYVRDTNNSYGRRKNHE